jgi:hypothetical protein
MGCFDAFDGSIGNDDIQMIKLVLPPNLAPQVVIVPIHKTDEQLEITAEVNI